MEDVECMQWIMEKGVLESESESESGSEPSQRTSERVSAAARAAVAFRADHHTAIQVWLRIRVHNTV